MNLGFVPIFEATELMEWLGEHRPDLADQIAPMSLWDGAQVLMRETGVVVKDTDPVGEGSAQFLKALKELAG